MEGDASIALSESSDATDDDADVEDLPDRREMQGLLHRWTLTFKDQYLEEEFMLKWDNQNLQPATLFLSICFALDVLHLLLMTNFPSPVSLPDMASSVEEVRQFANIIVLAGFGMAVFILRRRWLRCETTVLIATVTFSALITSHLSSFVALMLQRSSSSSEFLSAEPMFLLAYVLLNQSVQAMRVRSSRCWILPVAQLLMNAARYRVTAPWSSDGIIFISILFASASYFPWQCRWKDELRVRIDHLENRELRTKMSQERIANRIQAQRLLEIEERLKAMDTWAGEAAPTAQPANAAGSPQAPKAPREDRTVPALSHCGESSFGFAAEGTSTGVTAIGPNEALQRHMSGRQADAARIRKMAEHITERSYSVKDFFEDALVAFPELELFFAMPHNSVFAATETPEQAMGAKEYQRTIGALFSVYWMLRMDSDGKEGFCSGVSADWKVREYLFESTGGGRISRTSLGSVSSRWSALSHVVMKQSSDIAKRQKFFETANWSAMLDMVVSSVGGVGTAFDTERVEAMLCLTAFHDVLKMPWLCPQVAEAHAPYKGYAAGDAIEDHDVALAYVMEHYPELLPSYSILPPQMQELVLFTQSKMQFNHGWFIQAEAPPGLMLGALKNCLAEAQPGHLPFYFFHWLTDVSGAEGTPKGGAEKLVLKFPEPVLAAFLWSIPYLEKLSGMTETQVTEQYLEARWQDAFPTVSLPTGPSSIALLRLAVMAQGEAGIVAEAFHNLPSSAQELLSVELALTGCHDQAFERCARFGGPAFLIYYGPALLQRCRGLEEMTMGLQILAAILAAARGLWPRSLEEMGRTVSINVGELRKHDITSIMFGAPATQTSLWVLTRRNDLAASLQLLPAGDVNDLNCSAAKYWVLDLRFADFDFDALSV